MLSIRRRHARGYRYGLEHRGSIASLRGGTGAGFPKEGGSRQGGLYSGKQASVSSPVTDQNSGREPVNDEPIAAPPP